MGNICSTDESISVAKTLRARRDDNSVSPIDRQIAEVQYSDCKSTKLLDQKDSHDSENSGLIQPLIVKNGSTSPGIPAGVQFLDPVYLQIPKTSLLGLLNQKAERSPVAIARGNTMLLTHAESGSARQWEEMELSKKTAELQLYVVTWNMNGREPQNNNLSRLLDLNGEKHDLYVIGLQEAPKFSGEEALGKLLGENYCCVGMSSMMSLQLYVFARKSLRSHITGTMVDKVPVGGLGYVVGRQKGAAAVLLAYNNMSLLFITSHLAPHEGNLKERNEQVERISQSVFTKSNGLCANCSDCCKYGHVVEPQYKVRHVHNFVEDSDVVVWLGDLNYRVEMPRSSVGFLISHNLEEILWTKDQLQMAVQRGEVFTGFSEGPLLFPPTFKFDVGTDNYSKERTPSWTDRILYKVKSTCSAEAELMLYNSIPELKTSDHKPVVAHLTLKNCFEQAAVPSEK